MSRRLSRREVLVKGAVAGTVVWAAPVVESFTSRAAAASDPTGGPKLVPGCTPTTNGTGWSFLALLLTSGSTYYRIKFDGTGAVTDFGPGFAPGNCGDSLMRNSPGVSGSQPSVSATVNGDGSITVVATTSSTTYTLVDYVVHQGQSCCGPGYAGANCYAGPASGAPVGSVTFPEPTNSRC